MSYAPIRAERVPSAGDVSPHVQNFPARKKATKRARVTSRKPVNRTGVQGSAGEYPIIVHSHLCWDWVWQRPQQFLSRLSRDHNVLFVELVGPDPGLAAPLARFREAEGFPNITILRLQFPDWQWTDAALVDAERRRLVLEFVTSGPVAGKFDSPVQWFYDPMAVTAFGGRMGEILTVYDCMDELSQFKGAPTELLDREAELLARADVVFTGGRKLFESKSRFHNNCHYFGCGVDADHFGKARAAATAIPSDIDGLPRPIYGYFGVVDERLDYELIVELAASNPSGSVVFVGPAIKVDADALPRRENLYWLGQRAYEALPAYCKAFDVCLMPFALNAATEYINPTKALEYMATGRPIASTAVSDVVRNFGEVVKIAKSAPEFVAHCRQAAEDPDVRAIARGFELVQANSWDRIVSQLESRVREAIVRTR